MGPLTPIAGATGGLTDPSVAFLRTNGSTAGVIGDPRMPFSTIQSAFNAGARNFDIGVGTFGSLVVPSNVTLNFVGRGWQVSKITGISCADNVSLTVHDGNGKSVEIQVVSATGSPGAPTGPDNEPGNPGSPGGVITLYDCKTGDINVSGGAGSNATLADGSAQPGGDGGSGGVVTVYRSSVGGIYAIGALGGDGVDGGAAGTSGSGGTVTVDQYSETFNIDVSSDGGAGGGNVIVQNFSNVAQIIGPQGGTITASVVNTAFVESQSLP